MKEWKKSSCVLCAQNCGLEILIENGRMSKVRPDNANTLLRNPEWNGEKRACTLAVHPDDAKKLGVMNGQLVGVTTEAGSETGEIEITEHVRSGTVMIPHGFGLLYDGEVYGINVK
jgi:anaerobic selenocysteine-containing dehydrogenase